MAVRGWHNSLQSWLRAALAGLMMTVCSSCAWFREGGPILDPEFVHAERQLLSQNYPDAIGNYTRYLGSRRSRAAAADAYYGRGMAHFAQREYSLARGDFERCLKGTRAKSVKAIALLRLGECAMIEEDFQAAERAYKAILKETPYAFEEDEILFRLGVAYLRQGEWGEAEMCLGKVIRNFPYSPRRALAQEKMPGVDRFFSVQLGAYEDRERARAAERALRQKGYDAFVRAVSRGGRTYYCVRSGKFDSWKAVKHHASALMDAGFKDVLKVP